ncbi:hypothetical protein [Serratia grimesii]|uniref:hypothetical protein n=1 Tax=Serratia grimesii TaxID=82995 RepID=UPI000AADF976|nr:hypothetical protein [Serratia grimesii]CAI0723616.1 Uncharacterised protein [Serratia grimesii]CAI2443772.1 Uncharacterised protein [Serratia grimesii]SUI32715.1 Uncharacterised protein [Serratia grimesii]
MSTTRVYIDSTVTASRSLGRITFPITSLPVVIPGMILQWDVDSTSGALARNRVGAAMTVVGAPVIDGYEVTLNETNYIDTGIPIQNYNASDMTFISISKKPEGRFNIVGALQVNAPQRSRSHLFDTANNIGARWLNAGGGALVATLGGASLVAAADGVDGIFCAARSYLNNGSGNQGLRIDLTRTGANAAVTGGAPPTNITGNILIGASIDHATTVSGKVMAVLAFSRALDASEIDTIYRTYKEYYAGVGKTI